MYLDSKPITREEQVNLIRLYKEHHRERDLEAILASTVSIMWHIIRRHFQWAKHHSPDLFQEGCISIARSVDMWNEQVGTDFNSYAYVACKRSMFIYSRKHVRRFKYPDGFPQEMSLVKKALEDNPDAEIKEIVKFTGLKKHRIQLCLDQLNIEWVPIDEWNDPALGIDSIAVETAEKHDIIEMVRRGLATLSPKELELIESRYGIGRKELTLNEIAKIENRSGERIRQREVIILDKLKTRLKDLS